MADDGSVIRTIVIDVLKANGADVSPNDDMFLIAKGGRFEVMPIPEVCGRRLIHSLSRKFDTPIHHFYNPLMAPSKPEDPIQ